MFLINKKQLNVLIKKCGMLEKDHSREESITEDPEEQTITEDAKRTSLLRSLKKTLSL